MEPLQFNRPISDVFRLPYVVHDIRLDIHQVWSPSGIEQVGSAPQLRRIYAREGSGHRRNVERLREMRATRSRGWISDVALALVEQAGRNPAEVFREELEAALHDGNKAHYGCEGYFGGLFCHYGVMTPFFAFKQGSYSDGVLTINGTYPRMLAVGATGHHPPHSAGVADDAVAGGPRHYSPESYGFEIPRQMTELIRANPGRALFDYLAFGDEAVRIEAVRRPALAR